MPTRFNAILGPLYLVALAVLTAPTAHAIRDGGPVDLAVSYVVVRWTAGIVAVAIPLLTAGVGVTARRRWSDTA